MDAPSQLTTPGFLPPVSFEFTDNDHQNSFEMWVMRNGEPDMIAMLDKTLASDVRYAFDFKREVWWLLHATPNIMPLLEHQA